MNKGKTLDRRIETLSLELAFSSCIHFKPELRQTTFMEGCIGTKYRYLCLLNNTVAAKLIEHQLHAS